MKRSLGILAVTIAVGIGTFFSGSAIKTEAESLSNLKGKQDQLQNQRSNVQTNLNDAQQKMDSIKGQQADVLNDMKRVESAINDTNEKIREKSAKLEDTKAKIVKLNNDIKVIQNRIEVRNELLKQRARSYQETGGVVSYIDVLMNSTSFSDFVERSNAVATIMGADREIIKQAEIDKNDLAEKQTQVEKELSAERGILKDLQNMNSQLTAQQEEKNKLMASLQQQQKDVEEGMLGLQEQDQILAAQEATVKKAIQLEQEHQAEAAKEAATKGSANGPTVPVSSGAWTRPAPGIITSPFGSRPGVGAGDFHYGTDIAQRGDDVPIVAAADGVVLRSSLDPNKKTGYGNYVIITHSINGQIYTTVYAHMQTRMVSAGDVVKKGQKIGIMGATGGAQGQHLHFELHLGEWVRNSVNAIDPQKVIPF